jgi:hypothetical protein
MRGRMCYLRMAVTDSTRTPKASVGCGAITDDDDVMRVNPGHGFCVSVHEALLPASRSGVMVDRICVGCDWR